MQEILEKYKTYILIGVIVILIIIIGFMYSNNVTNKVEEPIKEEKTEEKVVQKRVLVDIKGKVKNPGVYELNEDERIIDVIKKAGGLLDDADTNYLNLSKKVKDEMVVIVYSKDEIKEYEKNLEEKTEVKEIIKYEIVEKEIPCPNTTNESCINNSQINKTDSKEKENTVEKDSTADSTDNLVNLNKATKEQLLTLPGIGESKADLILDYRNTSKFTSIEDIKNVKGIGDSLFEKIKDHITV